MERVVLEGWLNKRVSGNIYKKKNQRWFKIIELRSIDSFELALAYYQTRLEKSAKAWIYLREINEICDDHKYITVVSTTRILSLEAPSREDHMTWLNYLGYLCPGAKMNFKAEPPSSLVKSTQKCSDSKEEMPKTQNDHKNSHGFATLSSQNLENHIHLSNSPDKKLDRTASVFSRHAGDHNNNSFYQSREQEFYEGEEMNKSLTKVGKSNAPSTVPPQRQQTSRNDDRYFIDKNYQKYDDREKREPTYREPPRGPPSRDPPSRQPLSRAPRREDYYDDIPHVNGSYNTPRSYSRESEDRRYQGSNDYDKSYNTDRPRDRDRNYDRDYDRGRNYDRGYDRERSLDSRDRSFGSQDRGHDGRGYTERIYDERDRYYVEREKFNDISRSRQDSARSRQDSARSRQDSARSHQDSARSQQDSARSQQDYREHSREGSREEPKTQSCLDNLKDTSEVQKSTSNSLDEENSCNQSQKNENDSEKTSPTNLSKNSDSEEDIEYTTLDAITKRRNHRNRRYSTTSNDDSSDEDVKPKNTPLDIEAPKKSPQTNSASPVSISTPRRAKDLIDVEDNDKKSESAPKKSLNDFLKKENFQSDSKESNSRHDSSDDEEFDIKAEVRKYSSQNSMSRPPKSRPTTHSPLMQNSSGYNSAINHVRSGTPPRAGAHPGSQVDAGFVSENWDEEDEIISEPKSVKSENNSNPGVSADPNWLDENFDD